MLVCQLAKAIIATYILAINTVARLYSREGIKYRRGH